MTNPHDFVAAMRGLIGVPFADYGRDRETGLDCAGVILAASEGVGMHLADMPTSAYVITDLHPSTVLRFVRQWGVQRHTDTQPQHGDLLLIWMHDVGQPAHSGIYAMDTDSIIHCRPHGGVIEQPYSDMWNLRTSHVFEFNAFR